MEIKDGGHAFPFKDEDGSGGFTKYPGMSLRDYFAAAALQSINSNEGYFHANCGSDSWHMQTAEISYKFADAMLAAREGKK